jgi:hypothetical protein
VTANHCKQRLRYAIRLLCFVIKMGFEMNIYFCWRDYLGFGLSAVVQAESEERAIKLLGWKVDEDTHEINTTKIGVADGGNEREWCEESL